MLTLTELANDLDDVQADADRLQERIAELADDLEKYQVSLSPHHGVRLSPTEDEDLEKTVGIIELDRWVAACQGWRQAS